MGKFATKEIALEAKSILEKQLSNPAWLKVIEIDSDDHGSYLTTKIKDRSGYYSSGVKIPATIEVGSCSLKNCIMILG